MTRHLLPIDRLARLPAAPARARPLLPAPMQTLVLADMPAVDREMGQRRLRPNHPLTALIHPPLKRRRHPRQARPRRTLIKHSRPRSRSSPCSNAVPTRKRRSHLLMTLCRKMQLRHRKTVRTRRNPQLRRRGTIACRPRAPRSLCKIVRLGIWLVRLDRSSDELRIAPRRFLSGWRRPPATGPSSPPMRHRSPVDKAQNAECIRINAYSGKVIMRLHCGRCAAAREI